MIRFANAKINLGLFVTGKREDGFHNLESVFYPVPLCDVIELISTPEKGCKFSVSGIDVPGNQDENLVLRAVNLFGIDRFQGGIKIHLIKNIPTGAGLGGGSSDAAFTLQLLNELAKDKYTYDQLFDMAMQLGSDCGFFMYNKPALVGGRGESISDCPVSLKGYALVIVHPGIHVSTKEAFAGIQPQKPAMDLSQLSHIPVVEWRHQLKNDFEANVFEHHPAIRQIKLDLYDAGAVYASMSGSGSAVYGLFHSDAKPKLHFPNYFVRSYVLG